MCMKHLYYSTVKQLHQALGGVFPQFFFFSIHNHTASVITISCLLLESVAQGSPGNKLQLS